MSKAENNPLVPHSREHNLAMAVSKCASAVYHVSKDKPLLFVIGQKHEATPVLKEVSGMGLESIRTAELSLHEFPLPTAVCNPHASVLLVDVEGDIVAHALRVAIERRKHRTALSGKMYEQMLFEVFSPKKASAGDGRMFAQLLKEEQVYILPVVNTNPEALDAIQKFARESIHDGSRQWGKNQLELFNRYTPIPQSS